ncbi:hypothetical protein C2857_002173 [Epichloe festucae Fl1]|uniref:MARVEL domain-containing protein n=1 Tax=Epichloe festucae (strain Fl1) TaxID=877507 RepID=A0A7S9PWE9_EPIFF|nr:hypothetical protein C2857_002173 [Epichloe festucae Fl1]
MALDRLVSMMLRAAELVFAAIVAGVTGDHIHKSNASAWHLGRFIYTVTVSGIAIFLALIWLFPFSGTFVHWPVDVFVSILWWVAFGLLADLLGSSCGAIFRWDNVSPRGDQCGRFKAALAFSFLSAILWLASALIGIFWVRNRERHAARADLHQRRGWRRRRRV